MEAFRREAPRGPGCYAECPEFARHWQRVMGWPGLRGEPKLAWLTLARLPWSERVVEVTAGEIGAAQGTEPRSGTRALAALEQFGLVEDLPPRHPGVRRLRLADVLERWQATVRSVGRYDPQRRLELGCETEAGAMSARPGLGVFSSPEAAEVAPQPPAEVAPQPPNPRRRPEDLSSDGDLRYPEPSEVRRSLSPSIVRQTAAEVAPLPPRETGRARLAGLVDRATEQTVDFLAMRRSCEQLLGEMRRAAPDLELGDGMEIAEGFLGGQITKGDFARLLRCVEIARGRRQIKTTAGNYLVKAFRRRAAERAAERRRQSERRELGQ